MAISIRNMRTTPLAHYVIEVQPVGRAAVAGKSLVLQNGIARLQRFVKFVGERQLRKEQPPVSAGESPVFDACVSAVERLA